MRTVTASTLPIHSEAFNYNEASMHQSSLFSDSLKDLKNLGAQLYSAAEYFELSYANDEQKLTVVETLKEYAIKALVNTVDHLGSVTLKVNEFLDRKVDEVYETELRVSCIGQRIRTCQEYIDHEGLSQQSLVINTPKYQERYILPAGQTMHGANHTKSKYQGCSLCDEDDWQHFKSAVRATTREIPSASVSEGRHTSPSPRPSQRHGVFAFTATMPKKQQYTSADKRTVSPYWFPLLRPGSLSSRLDTPVKSRPTSGISSRTTTPNSSGARSQNPSEPQKSVSMPSQAERKSSKDLEEYPSKSKRLLKALLSRHKLKRDGMLYTG